MNVLITFCLNKKLVIEGREQAQANFFYRQIGSSLQIVDCIPSRDILLHIKMYRTAQIVEVSKFFP